MIKNLLTEYFTIINSVLGSVLFFHQFTIAKCKLSETVCVYLAITHDWDSLQFSGQHLLFLFLQCGRVIQHLNQLGGKYKKIRSFWRIFHKGKCTFRVTFCCKNQTVHADSKQEKFCLLSNFTLFGRNPLIHLLVR